MGFFDLDKLKKEQDIIEVKEQLKNNRDLVALRELIEVTMRTFDIFMELAKEFPKLAEIYKKKPYEIRTDLSNKKDNYTGRTGFFNSNIPPIYEYESVYSLPFRFNEYDISGIFIDSKGRLVFSTPKKVFPGLNHHTEEDSVFSLELYSRERFEEELKIAIHDKVNKYKTEIWVDKDRVNVRLNTPLMTLPFFLIKRSFYFKTEGCYYEIIDNARYEVPYHISINKRRPESEIIELMKNEFLSWGKSDYLYKDRFNG